MKIQILGGGCPKCKQLAENAVVAAQELGIKIDLEKVTDINEILKFGVMMTPCLVIEGEVKVIGKVASKDEIKTLLQK